MNSDDDDYYDYIDDSWNEILTWLLIAFSSFGAGFIAGANCA